MGPDRECQVGDYRVATVKTGRWKENAYVVQHVPSGEAVLVDPGDDAERIMDTIAAFDASPRVILLTHAHFDHIGALDVLCREYSLPFHMHSRDQPLLRRASLYAMSFERRIITVPDAHVPLEGAGLDWKGAPISYVHTPGHTDGGVCYHWGGLCFTGDTLMKRLIGRTDLPGSSGLGLSESISRLLETLAPETLMFPGHGGTWTVAEAREWWAVNQADPPEYLMEGFGP